MLKKFLQNQAGFSLIQGMILATAVAGMAYVGTKMTTDQKMLQRTADSNSRVDQLHKIIYSVLQNKANCERTFSQNGINPVAYACNASALAAQSTCMSLGGSPGAQHLNGEGPCYFPAGPGPDTICLPYIEAPSTSCKSYMLCHGIQSLIGTKDFLNGVWSSDSAAALFKINTNIGTTAYDPNLVYMNNSVSIVSMELTYPADLATADATLKILYGKLDSKDMGSRSGQGYGGNRIAKDISIKIQRNPFTKGYDSCYAVTGASNDTLNKDFCEQLGVTGAAGDKLFTWDTATNTCKLNLKCANDEVFTGWDSNGNKLCKKLASQMDLNNLLAGGLSCDLTSVKNVKFTVSGGKVQIDCSGGTGGGTPCSTSCDCPGSYDVCVSGVCTNRSTGCLDGELAKGDASCKWLCGSGAWMCEASAIPCGGGRGGTACSSSCDCPGSFDVCVSGVCTNRSTGCLDGELAKGDASCQWVCGSGSWMCSTSATACASLGVTGGVSGGGRGGTSCSSACDCPGSYDVCQLGVCTDRSTGCLTGEVAKGDAACKWSCDSSGMWTCPSGGTACGGSLPTNCFTAGYSCDCGSAAPSGTQCEVISPVLTTLGTRYCSNTTTSTNCCPGGTCSARACICL